jgi:hypothetical protein
VLSLTKEIHGGLFAIRSFMTLLICCEQTVNDVMSGFDQIIDNHRVASSDILSFQDCISDILCLLSGSYKSPLIAQHFFPAKC